MMKLLANSSYGYQFVDHSRHNVTKYLGDGKTHPATEQVVIKLSLAKPSLIEIEKFQYLQNKWKEEVSSIDDFLPWCNNKDILPFLEAMRNLIAFHHGKNIDTLKLGCTLPKLANFCL